jgi:hypothetical protein
MPETFVAKASRASMAEFAKPEPLAKVLANTAYDLGTVLKSPSSHEIQT